MTPPHSSISLTRRQLLRAAGGITFLALVPDGNGLFAAPLHAHSAPGALPLFTALPYLQPGTTSSRLVDGSESVVIAWQTNTVPAKFTLEYGTGDHLSQTADIVTHLRPTGKDKEDGQHLNYAGTLSNLALNQRYAYRVRMNGETLLEGYFTTRKPRGAKTRFVAFGDNSHGDISDRAIAYYAYRARPDFVMNTGDNVYEGGLDDEYARFFFPVYNADAAGPRIGAPLLRSVPFYTVMANHDVHGKNAQKHPVADFDAEPGSLAYYTHLHLPVSDFAPSHPTPVIGSETRQKAFTDCAGPRFPNMANYAFDYGDAHFLCLDSNVYVDPTDSALQAWIENDLKASDAPWKFVVYHHPAFNAGFHHYDEQHMRALTPLFEKHSVDVVLHGHEHTYQRTRPFRFTPSDLSGARKINSGSRLVPGTFTIDRKFDGQATTRPDGIVYLTTGAGGQSLYDPQSSDSPAQWLHPEDNNADYVARFISDRHSLTVCDMDSHTLSFTQIDEWGREVDRFRITKG